MSSKSYNTPELEKIQYVKADIYDNNWKLTINFGIRPDVIN